MLLASAVNAFAMAAVLLGPQKQLTGPEQSAWDQIRSSTLVVMDGSTDRCMAACIDAGGYFIAHRSAVRFPLLFARTSSGATLQLEVIAVDEPTQLALLALKQQGVATNFRPVSVYHDDKKSSPGSLLALLISGPVRAELVSKDRVGMISSSQRMFTLSEIRFEASKQRIAGALVFTRTGELAGVVDAALTGTDDSDTSTAVGGADGTGRAGVSGVSSKGFVANQYGPGELTVAYSVAPNVLGRVVDGFLSPNRHVAHPAIGIVCRNFETGGVEIQEISHGSAAEAAGLLKNDVILEIGGEQIKNLSSFVRAMQNQSVGSKVSFQIRRQGVRQEINVEIGQG